MGYRFEPNETISRGLSRIASEQIAKARDELRAEHPRAAVHHLRKRMKKLRGLVRLARRIRRYVRAWRSSTPRPRV